MVEKEPIEKIEFNQLLREEELKELLVHLVSKVPCKILYEFRDEGILYSEKLETSIFRGCEGDFNFEREKMTLSYLSKKDNFDMYQRMKLYYPSEQGNHNNLEVAKGLAGEIQKNINDFFLNHKL
jgi:hypothetical protein